MEPNFLCSSTLIFGAKISLFFWCQKFTSFKINPWAWILNYICNIFSENKSFLYFWCNSRWNKQFIFWFHWAKARGVITNLSYSISYSLFGGAPISQHLQTKFWIVFIKQVAKHLKKFIKFSLFYKLSVSLKMTKQKKMEGKFNRSKFENWIHI